MMRLLTALVLSLCLAACSSSSSSVTTPSTPPLAVTILSPSTTVQIGAVQQFSAKISGPLGALPAAAHSISRSRPVRQVIVAPLCRSTGSLRRRALST